MFQADRTSWAKVSEKETTQVFSIAGAVSAYGAGQGEGRERPSCRALIATLKNLTEQEF